MADIQGGMKKLNNVTAPSEAKKASTEDMEQESLRVYEDLYEKHNGDLDLIFEELGANPEKAKKPHNRPKDKAEFAKKYVQGFYNLLADLKAEAKEERNTHK